MGAAILTHFFSLNSSITSMSGLYPCSSPIEWPLFLNAFRYYTKDQVCWDPSTALWFLFFSKKAAFVVVTLYIPSTYLRTYLVHTFLCGPQARLSQERYTKTRVLYSFDHHFIFISAGPGVKDEEYFNLVSIFRYSSSSRNPVYPRHVDSSFLGFSLSSHRQSYIGLVFNSRFID
jgi:hypothetical protein